MRRYLAEIGCRGEQRSRRTLSPETARTDLMLDVAPLRLRSNRLATLPRTKIRTARARIGWRILVPVWKRYAIWARVRIDHEIVAGAVKSAASPGDWLRIGLGTHTIAGGLHERSKSTGTSRRPN